MQAVMTMPPTLGLILAGGLARRMGGGDKPLRDIGGRSMLARVIDRLAPQCDALVLNANGDAARFAETALPVVADSVADYPGPLAGILAGLDHAAAEHPEIRYVLSAPGDCPFLPRDLAARLHGARQKENAVLAVASSGGQGHPVVALWDVALRDALRDALMQEQRQVGRFLKRYPLAVVDWATAPLDPFFNANTAEDLTEAERLARIDDASRA